MVHGVARHGMEQTLSIYAFAYDAYKAWGLQSLTRSGGSGWAGPGLGPACHAGCETGIDIYTYYTHIHSMYSTPGPVCNKLVGPNNDELDVGNSTAELDIVARGG